MKKAVAALLIGWVLLVGARCDDSEERGTWEGEGWDDKWNTIEEGVEK